MTDSTKSIIAIVTSDAFDFEGPKDGEYQTDTPAGAVFAEFVEKCLTKKDTKSVSTLVRGEEGWTFDIEFCGNQYRIYVHWAPIGEPPADRWVVQAGISKSLLRSLFGREAATVEVSPIVSELRRVLDEADEIKEVKWITRQEFCKIY